MRAQLGYDALLHELVGVRLRKSASFTRWDARPLSPEQLEYAREDVLHLIEAAVALQGRLEAQGRPSTLDDARTDLVETEETLRTARFEEEQLRARNEIVERGETCEL